MAVDIYERLRQLLHEISPMGCPKTEDGVEMELLKYLFTPDEARVTVHLKPVPETAEIIAKRLDNTPQQTAELLDRMYLKGLILKHAGEGDAEYAALPIAPGIMETQTNIADDRFIRLIEGYFKKGLAKAIVDGETALLRTLPVESTIPADSTVAPYEQASELIRNAPGPIAVATCGCRKTQRRFGRGCDAPLENCLSFGDHAQFYIDSGQGREIDVDEALKILGEAAEAGLVHATVNFTDWEDSLYMCNCCKCCCVNLSALNKFFPGGQVKGLVPSLYVAHVDAQACTGCESCLERCQTNALSIEGDVAVLNYERCVGCGLCVPACSEKAIQLVERDEDDTPEYPKSAAELWKKARSERYPDG